MTIGIYTIRNTCNDMMYIGSSTNIEKRRRNHFSALNNNCHENSYLQRAWNKYGATSFEFEIVELCNSLDRLEREQHWLDLHFNIGNLYNLNPIASNPPDMTGKKQSLQHKENLNKTKIGKPHPHKGKPHTQETRELLRKIKSNPSDELRQRLREIQTGKNHSEKTRRKMSEDRSNPYLVISPDGQSHIVKRLSQFCQDHKLNLRAMYKAGEGKISHHNGYIVRKLAD